MTETSYTAKVGSENAAWLAGRPLLDGTTAFAGCFTDNYDGTVTFEGDTLAALRELDENHDASVDADGVMWIAGDGFPVTEAA